MRQEDIQKIIEQRQPLAQRVMKVRENLSEAAGKFENFNIICREIFNDKGLAKEFGNVGRFLDDADKLVNEAVKRQEELKHLQKRLTRNTLNIAVIGRARQGKSRLLQSITGLTAEEIPDSNLDFCTGVRSDIINEDTDVTYAVVHFLSEEKFLADNVAPYFAELKKSEKNIFSVPNSISAFKNFPLPELSSLNDTAMKQALNNLLEIQKNLPKFENLLGQRQTQIKKHEIRDYVAHDNKEGKEIFNYLAVESVEIFCRFPNEDVGSLRLIDLPGLGDIRIGDVARVVNALRDQVDLVFFISMPSYKGAGWQEIETNLYTEASSALGDKLPIDKWSFWVFNHDLRADNEIQCKMLRDTIEEKAQIKVSDTVIVDCSNPQDVSENLIDVALSYLSKNIEANDVIYAENLQALLKNTIQDIKTLTEKIKNSLKDEGDLDRDSDTFDVLFEDLWSKLREELEKCVEENSQLRQNRNKPYKKLQEKIASVLTEEEKQIPITEEDIERASRREGGIHTPYQESLHYLRTRLSSKIQESLDSILDEVLKNMKNEFCSILANTGRLEKRFGVSDYRLLGEMIKFIEESLYSKDMPTLLAGLKLLNDWTMSYRSFIQHRLRGALNALDPVEEESRVLGTPQNASQAVQILDNLYKQTIYKVRDALDNIYSEPNKAAFAVAEEFKDIMIRSNEMHSTSSDEENKTLKHEHNLKIQWRRFYRPIRGDIWEEQYGASQKIRNAIVKLRAPLENLVPLLSDSKFEFLQR